MIRTHFVERKSTTLWLLSVPRGDLPIVEEVLLKYKFKRLDYRLYAKTLRYLAYTYDDIVELDMDDYDTLRSVTEHVY